MRSSRSMRKAIRLKELDNFDELKDWIMQGDLLRGKLNIFIEKNIVYKFNLAPTNENSIGYLNAKLKTLLDKIVYQLPGTAIMGSLFNELNQDDNEAKKYIINWLEDTINEIFEADFALLNQFAERNK